MTEEELREIEREIDGFKRPLPDGYFHAPISPSVVRRLIAEVRELQEEVKYMKSEQCGCLY